MADLRQDIINLGIDQRLKASTINRALQSAGLREYNPLLEGKNYANLPANFKRSAGNIVRDLRTAGGVAIKASKDFATDIANTPLEHKGEKIRQAFLNAAKSPNVQRTVKGAGIGALAGNVVPGLGAIPGAILGGTAGLLGKEGFINSILQPYDTNLNEIRSGKADWKNIAQGIMYNPTNATLDILSVPGVAKGLGGVTRSVRPSAEATLAKQQLIPSNQLREVNRILTESTTMAKSKSSKNYNTYNLLQSTPYASRKNIVQNIITNEGKLTDKEKLIADGLKNELRSVENDIINLGYIDKDVAKHNVASQYVMSKYGNNTSFLTQKDIDDIINNNPLRKEVIPFVDNKVKSNVRSLYGQGTRLYDEGKISYLSQSLNGSTDPLGVLKASDFNKGKQSAFDYKRIVGRTPIEEQALLFDNTVKNQLDTLTKASEIESVTNDILNIKDVSEMLPNEINALGKLSEGKTIISPSALKTAIRDAISTGTVNDIESILHNAKRITPDARMIDKVYAKALVNALTPSKDTASRGFLNSFKKSVLANPHWFFQNRVGNVSNNLINGVTGYDYLDTFKYKKYLPEQLKYSTSFGNYITDDITGITKGSSIGSSLAKGWNKVLRSGDNFKASEKSLSDVGRYLMGVYSGLSDVTSNPIYKLESNFELADRYANYIRQAKRYSSANNMELVDVLKKAKKDRNLFRQLNDEVNKSLGDYTGRNYSIPNEFYSKLGDVVPFYRFLTQTGRTTLHQLANNPLAFQSIIMNQARLGNPISEYILQNYNIDPEMYKGGIPYRQMGDNNIRTVGSEPLPLGAILESPGSISPYYTMLSDIMQFKRGNRYATSPERTLYELQNPKARKQDYKPSGLETSSLALNTLLSNTFNPYRLVTTYIPELAYSIPGLRDKLSNLTDAQGNVIKGLPNKYDTNIFINNPNSYVRSLPSELIGKWLGIQSFSNYPKYKSNPKREARARAYKIKSIKGRNEGRNL